MSVAVYERKCSGHACEYINRARPTCKFAIWRAFTSKIEPMDTSGQMNMRLMEKFAFHIGHASGFEILFRIHESDVVASAGGWHNNNNNRSSLLVWRD